MPRRPVADVPIHGDWGKRLGLLLSRIGASDVPVLIQGETGVGKEVLARKIHHQSRRQLGPFLKLNCAALPSELVESELFGYERGAFTGAVNSTPGKFEMADQGTILLDEIGDMDLRLQAKLLQVVQDQEFLRLGARETSRVNVRIITATHRNLEDAVADGAFREDLFYRLNVIDIHIPPLRERKDEIVPLAQFFAGFHSSPECPPIEIPPSLIEALQAHRWPGNIRELENVIRKFLVLRNADLVIEDLVARANRRSARSSGRSVPREAARPALPNPAASDFGQLDDERRRNETSAIVGALEATRWNRRQAAERLGIDYKALLYRMKKLGLGDNAK